MARILLIDDDDAVREVLQLMLAQLGHTTVAARDGEEALGLYHPAAHDLVITDLVMPGKGGIEVVKQLREKQPELKIIAMSGGGRPGSGANLSAAREAGASAVLAKPFTFTSLAALIGNLLPAAPPGGGAAAVG
jgi:CheY-like chemotaxis protein